MILLSILFNLFMIYMIAEIILSGFRLIRYMTTLKALRLLENA